MALTCQQIAILGATSVLRLPRGEADDTLTDLGLEFQATGSASDPDSASNAIQATRDANLGLCGAIIVYDVFNQASDFTGNWIINYELWLPSIDIAIGCPRFREKILNRIRTTCEGEEFVNPRTIGDCRFIGPDREVSVPLGYTVTLLPENVTIQDDDIIIVQTGDRTLFRIVRANGDIILGLERTLDCPDTDIPTISRCYTETYRSDFEQKYTDSLTPTYYEIDK